MPRQIAKVDANQPEIVHELRAVGATVLHLHQLGNGAPDLVVGFRGINYFMEIKNREGSNRMTDDEKEFRDTWRGQYVVIWTPEEALRVIGAIE